MWSEATRISKNSYGAWEPLYVESMFPHE